jgi:hypothetical protein
VNAWLAPQASTLFSLFSLLSLLAVLAPLARQGRFKAAVTGASGFALAVGLGLLALGAAALAARQPPYVVTALSVVGLVLSVVFGALLPSVIAVYREVGRSPRRT